MLKGHGDVVVHDAVCRGEHSDYLSRNLSRHPENIVQGNYPGAL